MAPRDISTEEAKGIIKGALILNIKTNEPYPNKRKVKSVWWWKRRERDPNENVIMISTKAVSTRDESSNDYETALYHFTLDKHILKGQLWAANSSRTHYTFFIIDDSSNPSCDSCKARCKSPKICVFYESVFDGE